MTHVGATAYQAQRSCAQGYRNQYCVPDAVDHELDGLVRGHSYAARKRQTQKQKRDADLQ